MVKVKTRYECEHCGKVLKSARALAGHLWFAHQKRPGEKASLKEDIKLLEREKGINPDTVDKINKILEKVDGNNPATPEDVQEISTKLDDVGEKIQELIAKLNEIIQKNPDDGKKKDTNEEKEDKSWFL